MNTKAIIICAGEATRWGDYLGTKKHLIEIEGERLLNRTVRLLKERGVEEIYIVVKEITDAYHVEGATQWKANLNPDANVDADKFLSSQELWNDDGRTLVFYGDCYFTDEAMDTIVNFTSREWTLFCRPNASKVTGTPWGECFAQSFYTDDIPRHRAALLRIARLYKDGVITRCGGWEHYRAILGRPDARIRRPHVMGSNYVEIDDWTDDFDYPKDYDSWIEKRSAFLLRGQEGGSY